MGGRKGGRGRDERRLKVKCVTVTNGIYLINILTSRAPPPRLHVAGDGALADQCQPRYPSVQAALISLMWLLDEKRRGGAGGGGMTRKKKSFK